MGLGNRLDEDIEAAKPSSQKVTTETLAPAYDMFGVVKGTFSKAISPTVKNKKETLGDRFARELETERKGYAPERPKMIVDPRLAEELSKAPKSLGERLDEDNGLQLGSQQPSVGDRILTRFGEGFKKALTVMSIDEHAIVGGLYKVQGLKDKPDMSDYTWTNWLKDTGYNKAIGLKDDWTTETMGLSLSILLSPSTYLTFGSTAAAKIGLKTAVTGRGLKLINEVTKARSGEEILKATEKAGRILSGAEENLIKQNIKKDVEQEVIKRFGEINGINKSLEVGADVSALPKSVVSKGGMKLELGGRELNLISGEKYDKFTDSLKSLFAPADVMMEGKKVLGGEEIAKNTITSGLYHYAKTITQGAKVQGVIKDVEKTRKFLGEKFVHNFGIDQGMLNAFRRAGPDADKLLDNPGLKGSQRTKAEMAFMLHKWEEAETEAIQLSRRYNALTEKSFQKLGLDKKQRKAFADTLIKASVESDLKMRALIATGKEANAARLEAFKPILHQDQKVQAAIDLWLGQGKRAGMKSIADKIADKSKLFEDGAKLPIWFPGIIEDKIAQLKMPKKLGEAAREFLEKRLDPAEASKYTRDPVQAIGQRLTQIAYANIQDKFFDNIVAKKLGGLVKASGNEEAMKLMKNGYVILRRPFGKQMVSGNLAERAKEATYLVKEDFYKLYRETVTQNETIIPIITPMTKIWKRSVTTAFPAFHARNFSSNIVLNSLNIGGHAVNPVSIKHATDMVLGRNLDAIIKTDIGEKISLKSFMKEAEDIGVVKKGLYQADISGVSLPKYVGESWADTLNIYANPMSEKWLPNIFGRKFGEAIETQARLINYMTWRKKGLNPRLAAMETNEALFDYQAITGFEKTLNNTFLPFYTFSKKNISAHMRLFARRPGAITAQLKMFRDLGPTETELNEMPDWIKNKHILGVRDNFASNFGMPLEDIIELSGGLGREGAEGVSRNLLLRLNPFLRFGVETVTKEDIFSKRQLLEANNANEFKRILVLSRSEKLPKFIREPFVIVKNWLKLEEDPSNIDKVIGDPNKLHILRSAFTSRYQSTIGMLEKDDKDGYEKALQLLTGVIKVKQDPGIQLTIKKREATKKAKAIALETNLARPIDLPWFFSGDKYQAKIANRYMQTLKDAQSVEEVNEILENMKEEAVEEQKFRVGIEEVAPLK